MNSELPTMNRNMVLNSGRNWVEFISMSLSAKGGADWETKENRNCIAKQNVMVYLIKY
jgi:hypothetical protein